MAKPSNETVGTLVDHGYRDIGGKWQKGRYVSMLSSVCAWDDDSGYKHGFVQCAIPGGPKMALVVAQADKIIERIMSDDSSPDP